jgi:hypothetical protein
MKNRILILALALVMCLSLAACGGSTTPPANDTPKVTPVPPTDTTPSKNNDASVNPPAAETPDTAETPTPLLTDNPSAEAVKTAIQQIPTITEIGIVTEDNDPNNQLGKQGGYTGCLFFTDSNAPKTDGADAIEKGADGGGCIEIYANADDAKRRDEYLASFDGTVFASGSHTVVGTLVVHTSSQLTASQQKALESQLINVLDGKTLSVSEVAPTPQSTPQPAPATVNWKQFQPAQKVLKV